jgi:hypothetical protein
MPKSKKSSEKKIIKNIKKIINVKTEKSKSNFLDISTYLESSSSDSYLYSSEISCISDSHCSTSGGTGATGATGATGPTGYTGPTGSYQANYTIYDDKTSKIIRSNFGVTGPFNDIYIYDGASGPFTITLPNINNLGPSFKRIFTFVNNTNSTGDIKISPTPPNTILGTTGYEISLPYASTTVMSNYLTKDNWFII